MQAACSIRAIMHGVAKTCRLPLPMASAVLVSRTTVSAVPVRPGFNSCSIFHTSFTVKFAYANILNAFYNLRKWQKFYFDGYVKKFKAD